MPTTCLNRGLGIVMSLTRQCAGVPLPLSARAGVRGLCGPELVAVRVLPS